MIAPGGTPGVTFGRSATTRFNNVQVKAAKASMPFNAAAQQSLRMQTSASNPSGPPVGPTQNSPDQLLSGLEPPSQDVDLPTGGPQGPANMAEGFDPMAFIENSLDEVAGRVTVDRFLKNPQVKDALTRVRVKSMFNADNPNLTPDPRTLLQKVLSQIAPQE